MPARKHPPRPRPARRGPGLLRRGVHLSCGLLATVVLTVLVAGIPWGLARYIGWPLPRHLPTWPEIEAALLAPMSTSFLLHTLACILWPLWGAFVLDVARATVDEARAFPRPSMPHAGPLNALAAVLVGTIIMALLAQRPAASAASAPAPAVTSTATTVSTPTLVPARLVAFARPATVHTQGHSRATGTVEVEPPRDGIYDSLWRIADRTLGDGNRWPEIYTLNRGRPQPDGHSLTTPNLIRPGWILRLPNDTASSGTYDPGDREPASPAPKSPRPPQTSVPTTPSPSPSPDTSAPTSTPPPSATHDPQRQPGVSLPTGAFVGLGLAALITAALLTVRRRRRVRYRPGSGERDDLTIAPVVRALRIAHDDATHTDDPNAPESADPPGEFRLDLPEVIRPTGEDPDAPAPPPVDGRVIGVKDGQALAWNLAHARGLGLIGPGALDAIRALLVALLAEKTSQPTTGPVEILIPASDARTLIGDITGQPAGLRIVDDLDAALEAMEAELLTRSRTHTAPDTPPDAGDTPYGDLVLVATPSPHADRRLQALLDNGSTLGLAGILVGQWRPGATTRIRPDGTVTAISPSAADTLTGARLFTLPTDDAQALLDLLDEAQPVTLSPAPRSPAITALRHPAPGGLGPGTEPATSRPTPPRPRRRLAHGPATTPPDTRQLPTADSNQHRTGPDNVKRPEPSPATPDSDEPHPATTTPGPPPHRTQRPRRPALTQHLFPAHRRPSSIQATHAAPPPAGQHEQTPHPHLPTKATFPTGTWGPNSR